MQSFGNYNINPNPPVYVGGGEKRKKKKEEKPSEDIASKIALPIAVTAGAALAICAGVFGVNKALGGGKKVVGETVEKTAGTVKETAKKANKTIREQQQEISKILKNLQAGQEFTKNEATQLTQYLKTYTSTLTLGKYPGLDITSYTQLINNFIKNINKKFKNDSVESIDIEQTNDPLIEDIGKINNMFDQIENLVKSQNQSSEINQNIEKINIEVEEEKEPESPVEPVQNPVAKFEFVDNKYKQGSFLQNLNVEKLSSLDLQHIACCRLQDNTHVLVIDSNDLKLDKTPVEASSVKFDDVEVNAYLYKLEDAMPPSDMTTLLSNSRITSALVSETDANFLQQYLTNQAEKVSGAKAKELEAMINLTNKVKETITADEFNETIKAILDANTNLINAIQQQQQQLNAKLKAFDDDKDSSKLFDNFASLKTLISTYNLEANSIYYIDSNNEWKNVEDKVPDDAKFVINVGDKTTDFTITKKAPYCDLVYDKDGHITVDATPAKKYIEIITAPEPPQVTYPTLQCQISDADKETALKNLQTLLQNNDDFKEAYKKKRGGQYQKDTWAPLSGFNKLKSAENVAAACNILTKNPNIKEALEATTITSDTYTDQSALNAAIAAIAAIAATDKTPYLKDILTTNTTSKKLHLFSGDTEIGYTQTLPTTNKDGSTTVEYTSTGTTPKKYTVTCSSSNEQNTVTITVDGNPYTYTVSENECTLDQNVPAENKDLFEHFVYMALQNDSTKQKAFAQKLLSLEYNHISSEMKNQQKKNRVIRLIQEIEPALYKDMINTGKKQYLYIDESGNILTNEPNKKIKYVKFWKRSDGNTIVFSRHTPQTPQTQ